MSHNIKILDSTLREGEQTNGVSFSVEEKVNIARMLDEFGVDRIEAGHPLVSPKIEEAVKRIVKEGLTAEILAHNRAMIPDLDKSIDCGVDGVAIFLASSDLHLKDKLNFSREQAIEKVVKAVEYAKAHGLKIRFTPEDATRTDYDYLVEISNAAIKAGAHRIGLADTLGIMQPHTYADTITKLRKDLLPCEIELHCHNDFGMAVANSIAGLRAGADCVHTTINGLGERAGITDMASFVMAMEVLNQEELGHRWKTRNLVLLPKLSTMVEKTSGILLSAHSPIIGINAFSHKSGVHTDGVLKNPKTYEPFSPELIGRTRNIIIDRYTGRKAVEQKLAEYGIAVNEEKLLKIIQDIKRLGDERKIIHETDIIDIAERNSGIKTEIVPEGINAIAALTVESHNYTSSVVRKLKSYKGITHVFETTGDHDVNVLVKVNNVAELNDLIEEFRTIPGIRNTNTNIVLKKYEVNGNGNGYANGNGNGNGNGSCNSNGKAHPNENGTITNGSANGLKLAYAASANLVNLG